MYFIPEFLNTIQSISGYGLLCPVASLGALSLVQLLNSSKGPVSKSSLTSWGILPQTPVFSLRSARCHWHISITALAEVPGPKDLIVSHRTSWGILPQTPVFSLRSARCHWHISITALAEVPGPKDLIVSHSTSWGILPQAPVSRFARRAVTGHFTPH
jgi:hypothetical protein